MFLRLSLFLIWFVGFLVCLGILLKLFYALPASGPGVKEVVQPLVAIFVPYLGPIIAFWFAQQSRGGANTPPSPAFYIAALCSLAFNAVLVIVFILLIGKNPSLQDLSTRLADAASLAALLSFLVGPAIGFYFGRTKQ